MQIAKDLAGFTPAEADDLRKAIGKKMRALMASLRDEVPRGLRGATASRATVAEALWDENERSRRLLVQQGARGLLRADRLPHGLPQGELPRAVHGGADLVRHADQGQGAVLRRRVRARWASRCCRPTSTRSGADFAVVDGKIRFGLTAVKGVGEGAVRAIVQAREEGGAVHVALGLLRARRRAADQQARAREPDQVRRPRLDRRDARRRCWRRSRRRSPPARSRRPTRSPGQGSIFDLGEPVEARRRTRAPPAGARRRVRPARAARVREGDARAVPDEPPARRGARPAAPQASTAAARPRRTAASARRVSVGGLVAGAARDDARAAATRWRSSRLDDGMTQVEVVVFGKAYGACREHLVEDAIVIVQGPRRPPRRGRDEARARSRSRPSRPSRRAARCGCASTAASPARRSSTSSARVDPRVPRRGQRRGGGRDRRGRARAAARARATGCGPRRTSSAEVRVLGGEAQLV